MTAREIEAIPRGNLRLPLRDHVEHPVAGTAVGQQLDQS